jgi:hypothetical protein
VGVAPVTWPVAMVTGHRPQHLKLDSIDWITGRLHRIAIHLRDAYGTRTMRSGMAAGVDLIWARTAQLIRQPLSAYIPFPQQPDIWTDPHLVEEWQDLVAYARRSGDVHTTGDCPPGPGSRVRAIRLLHKRNDQMIDDTAAESGVCVAVLRSSRNGGGTWSAVKKIGDRMPVIHVDPDLRTVTPIYPPTAVHYEQEALPL